MVLKTVSVILFAICLHKANSNVFRVYPQKFFREVIPPSSNLAKCTSMCEKTFPLTSNKIARSECCDRGCRFYGIAELVGTGNRPLELNISRDACYSCCFEGYRENNDKEACQLGCDSMAKLHRDTVGLAGAEVSLSFFLEEGDGSQTFQAGEILEPDDLLTDPALKRQLTSDLIQDNKIPQVQVKTLPIQPDEFAKWWNDCAAKYVAIPRCVTASVIIFLILFALWNSVGWDSKPVMSMPGMSVTTLGSGSDEGDEAPLLPPKYSLPDEDIKV